MKGREQEKVYIRQYLNGELTRHEVELFEKRLEEENEFALLVAEEVVKHNERAKLKDDLEDIRSQLDGETSKGLGIWRAAAALLLLVSFAFAAWYFSGTNTNDAKLLFSETFEPYRPLTMSRGVSDSSWATAMAEYRAKNYQLTLRHLATQDQTFYLVNFYQGICYLALQNPEFEKAIEQLTKAIEVKSDYQEQIRWYLALALMGAEREKEATKHLQMIADSQSGYKQQEARNLLEKF